jgi:hypothetical protein
VLQIKGLTETIMVGQDPPPKQDPPPVIK